MPCASLDARPEYAVGFDETGKLSTLLLKIDCSFWTKALLRIEIR